MNNAKELERRFCELLGLTKPPVAVSFLPEEPTQLPRAYAEDRRRSLASE